MKPRFALDLSNEAIRLLERGTEGWTEIGSADLGDPRLDRRLAELRRLAETRAPEGFCSKLILPNSQILYLTIDAPGPDAQCRRSQIAAALAGRTPYPVEELVFDWSGAGSSVRVAVLARVTLEEAQEFTDAYGFRPVSFVAVPADGHFGGEPFFGVTSMAARHLPEGTRLDRDQDPVRILGTESAEPQSDATPAAPAGDAGQEHDEGAETPAVITVDGTLPADTQPLPGTGYIPGDSLGRDSSPQHEDAVGIDESGTDETDISPSLATDSAEPSHSPATPTPVTADPVAEEPSIASSPQPPRPSDFQTRRTGEPRGDAGVRLSAIPPRLARLGETSSRAAPGAASREAGSFLMQKDPVTAGTTLDDGDKAFLSNRVTLGTRVSQAVKTGSRTVRERMSSVSAAASTSGPVRSVFGAQAKAMGERGRKGVVMGAAAAAAIVLLTVGLWAIVLPTRVPPEPSQTDVSVAPTPEPVPSAAPLANQTAPADPEPDPPSPGTSQTAEMPSLALPGFATAAPPSLRGSSSEAEARLPQRATDAMPPAAEPDLMLSTTLDVPPQTQPLPQPYGTRFSYDSDGQITPTADGVITPDGFTLISGRPASIPPPRPTAPALDDSRLDASTADPRLAGKAPRQRPESIAVAAQTAQTNAERMAAAAEAAAQAEAAEFEFGLKNATAQAVASSRRPEARPAAIATLAAQSVATAAIPMAGTVDDTAVNAALAEAQATAVELPVATAQTIATPSPADPPSPAQDAEIDEPEIQDGIATMPTTRTVAKQSTIANAIDLGDLNLIGVYGSSSNRRALVRMPNGRYIKVKVGDRLDGGKVAAIGDSELSYIKRGQTLVIRMIKKG